MRVSRLGATAAIRLLLLAPLALTHAASATDWGLCRALANPPAPFAEPVTTAGQIRIDASALDTLDEHTLLFEGAVKLQQADQWLTADRVQVFDTPRRILAEGNIEASRPDFLLRSETAEFREEEDYGRFDNVNYQFNPRHAYGKAGRIEQRGELTTLTKSSFSTCNPGDRDWELKADEIRLDRAEGFGTAVDATLYFKEIPLLYLPWATFPIDDRRRSGLLYPSFGSSVNSGLIINQPVYWNIAPNYDATFTPRYLSKRGLKLDNQFRYLGATSHGELEADLLNNDREQGDDRFRYHVEAGKRLSRQWNAQLTGTRVSDKDYFNDFGDSLLERSLTHLERRFDLNYRDRFLEGLIRAQAFQTIDPTIALADRPYRRLPQIAVDGHAPFDRDWFDLSLESEFTHFSHDARVADNRFDLAPRLTLQWQKPGYYVRPGLAWRYSRYDLEATASETARELTREVPVLSLDSGLFFERATADHGLQTLEPRLYYLYVPYRDQRDFPVFDTNETAFSFATLFRENRFSGVDRIGDANQLTLALTTRKLLAPSGLENWRGSLGQVFYFRDREVTLPGAAADTTTESDYAAELAYASPRGLNARASVLVDDTDLRTRASSVSVGYRGENNRIVNLEYRLRRDEIEQANLSFTFPLQASWRVFGRWQYALQEQRNLEVMAGVQYESCCWAARVLSRRFIINEQEDYNDALYFELVLKGLGSLGTAGSLLQQLISGYTNEFE